MRQSSPPFEPRPSWPARVCLTSLIATAACASGAPDADSSAFSPQAPEDASSTGTDAYRSAGSFDGNSAAPIPILGLAPPADASSVDSFVGCAATSEQAQRVPLDLYFMLDTSGSMADLVADRESKWNQVSAAIAAFVRDPASAGVGVGLQYFPVQAAGLPSFCTSDTQCGAWGPCITSVCDDGSESICHSDFDCFGVRCIPVTACAYDANTLCGIAGESCGTDTNGFALGTCEATPATCANGDSCSEQDYETPAVGIAPLPAIGDAIVASLASHAPQGGTPTPAALQGAIDGARLYATENPGHTVVAVLATDGMPNEVEDPSSLQCATAPGGNGTGPSASDVQVAQIAASGWLGNPPIRTFAIGVFTPDDIGSGTATLAQVASAGGTGVPFIISTEGAGQTIEQQFTAALNAIRGTSLPCQFQMPSLGSGTPEILDFNEVNVRFTAGSGSVITIDYVESAAGCDPAGGGWYYDVDPSDGAAPNAIETCPATCSTLESDPDARVDIVLGCRTVVPAPP